MAPPSSITAPTAPRAERVVALPVRRVDGGRGADVEHDLVAVEEPLEIRLGYDGPTGRTRHPVAITMRTPGHDGELAVGFLLHEGVATRLEDVTSVRYCPMPDRPEAAGNVLLVDLRAGVSFDPGRLERAFYTTSSCGVCGKASLDALETAPCPVLSHGQPRLRAAAVCRLPELLRAAQPGFRSTGGLHAAGLFTAGGSLLGLREDVGRHNAVDKLVGAHLLGTEPALDISLAETVLVVSGRASFELTQKAAVAGIPVLAAVGAPSSLAVDLARRFGLTLLGFVRDDRFNVYHDAGRLDLSD